MSNFKSPVLFLIFNRPEKTMQVFDAIRKAQPSKLYIAADGPRKNVPNDILKCKETREVLAMIDWECEVYSLLRDENLGCAKGVSSAIIWFFEHEEDGIILEDDCVPHQDFFPFCSEMLEKYRFDNRVWLISGTNLMTKWECGEESYFFSKIGGIWGWATWRRTWKDYDLELKLWKEVRVQKLFKQKYVHIFLNGFGNYDRITKGDLFTWDYQFGFLRLLNNGLSVVPKNNLIANIGFDHEATHTVRKMKISNLSVQGLSFPLTHPSFIIEDVKYDYQYAKTQKKKFRPIRNFLRKMKLHILYEKIEKSLS